MNAGRICTPSIRFGNYSTYGCRTKEVVGRDEVIGVPLCARYSVWGLDMSAGTKLTISSGSSGKRVTVPEPSFSISCLIRRIVSVALESLRQRFRK